MLKPNVVCSALAFAVAVATGAKEFPLEFKTLTAEEAMTFAGSHGAYAKFQSAPQSVIKEPPGAGSSYPLYGQLPLEGPEPRWIQFRLAASGDGTGHDRLILDWNWNLDLTDDTVFPAIWRKVSRDAEGGMESIRFGPIPAPPDKKIGERQPSYFAEAWMYQKNLKQHVDPRQPYSGGLTLKTGWYLEAVVEMDGLRRKLALVDDNCNMRLGDPSVAAVQTNRSGRQWWHYTSSDQIVQGPPETIHFTGDEFWRNASPFGPVIYLGSTPYWFSMAADGKTVLVEPWPQPLGELVLQPHGEQVRDLYVLREHEPGRWLMLYPKLEAAKARVPPGNYRAYSCWLKARATNGETVTARVGCRAASKSMAVPAGQSISFPCGAPLDIVIKMDELLGGGEGGLWTRAVRGLQDWLGFSSSPVMAINARCVGAGGETYYEFSKGDRSGGQLAGPKLSVRTRDGQAVATGNLEFG